MGFNNERWWFFIKSRKNCVSTRKFNNVYQIGTSHVILVLLVGSNTYFFCFLLTSIEWRRDFPFFYMLYKKKVLKLPKIFGFAEFRRFRMS